jgi:hypothetical protein
MKIIEAFLRSIHGSSGALHDIEICRLAHNHGLAQAAWLSFQGIPLRPYSYIRQLFLARV